MAVTIFPTENDVAATPGDGLFGTEDMLSDVFGSSWRRNFIISGLTASVARASQFEVSVSAGTALVDGYLYTSDAAQTVTVNASETNARWYLQLDIDTNGVVQGSQWTRVVNPAMDGSDAPANSVEVFQTISSASEITNLKLWRRTKKDPAVGEYVGNGGSLRQINLGFRPQLVVIIGLNQGNNDQIFAVSCPALSGGEAFGMYWDSATVRASSDTGKRPMMDMRGFRVSALSGEDNLNESGQDYRYIAFP